MAQDTIQGDRRSQRRYAVELDLEYRIIDQGRVIATGGGKTGNMSSGGVLFRAEDDFADGRFVELYIRWPAVLGNAPFIELCVSGRVVRSGPDGAALRMTRYHFQQLRNPAAAFDQLCGRVMIQ